MHLNLKGLLFTLAMLTILGGRVASAAMITQFTDRAAFNAATMNRTIIDFEGLAPSGGFTFYGSPGSLMLSGVTFASNGPLFVQNSSGGPLGVGSRLTFQQATPTNILNVTLPANVSAVGFDFIAGDPVTVTLSIGQSSQSFNIGPSPFPNFSFTGFTADEPISAIQVTSVGGADLDNFTRGINEDECPNSDLSATVAIDGCNSGVPNTVFPTGCTISDLIAECAEGASNHGQFVSCVSHVTDDLKKAGTITGQQKGAIQRCAAQADIP